MGEEAPHRVLVERAEVTRVELLVVRDEELLGDRAAEARVEQLLEARRRRGGIHRRLEAREVEIVQAVDEVLLGELVDVLLEGEVDPSIAERDERLLVDREDALPRHPLAEPRLDVLVLEVEEVAGVVPDEPLLLHRLAVAADLAVGFEHEVVVVAESGGRREAADACAEDEGAHGMHRGNVARRRDGANRVRRGSGGARRRRT